MSNDTAQQALARAVECFIERQSGAASTVRITRRYAGGMSWSTYGIALASTDERGRAAGERELILRLGRDDGLLAPYSATPEVLVLTALADSAVPVPKVLWHSEDASHLGAPFLVVEKVEGQVRSPFQRVGNRRTEASTRAVGEQFVDALAALHNFDWRSSVANELRSQPTVATAAEAQVERWKGMIEASGTRRLPLLHRAVLWLEENAPPAPRLCIVHGDYRAGNFLELDDRITAILDWELMHLGDPHEDIAWAAMRFLSGKNGEVSGLLPRATFMARYEAATGLTVSPKSLRFYEVLALVKLCAMSVSAASRIEAGAVHDLRMATLQFGLPGQLLELHRLIEEPAC